VNCPRRVRRHHRIRHSSTFNQGPEGLSASSSLLTWKAINGFARPPCTRVPSQFIRVATKGEYRLEVAFICWHPDEAL
jgi:hypothetical protein